MADELSALLRDRGGLEGLARELGQDDPNAWAFEPAANENAPFEPTSSARVRAWLHRIIAKGRRAP